MAISFDQIPGNLRVPFFSAEIGAAQSPYESISRLLLFGQMLDSGIAAPDEPIIVASGEDGLFGAGSMASIMYKTARTIGAYQEIWVVPLSDPDTASAAEGLVTISGATPVATPGNLVLYIDGNRIAVPVDTSMTQRDITAAITDAIQACPAISVDADPVTQQGTPAHATVTFTGTATSAGTVSVAVNGVTYSGAIASGLTAAQAATALAVAINDSDYVLLASAAGAVVTITSHSTGDAQNAWTATPAFSGTGLTVSAPATFTGGTDASVVLTAKNKGSVGGGIGIYTRLNQDDGSFADEMVTIQAMSNGVGDPAITNALANLGDDLWDFIALPYAQYAYFDELDGWLSSRWGPMAMTYGTYYTASVGRTFGQVMSLTSGRNGPYGSLMPMYNSPQSAAKIAAAYAAVAAVHLQDAPELSRPLQTLELTGILPPKAIADRWSIPQRQSFYYAGASAYVVDGSGKVAIDRAVTFYQRDSYGNPDQSWLDVNTLAQLMYGMRYIRQYVSETYPRCALVDSNPNNIQNFVTVDDIKNAMVHAYTALVDLGVFQDVATFESLLIVERNSQDRNRVDTFLPLEAVNQLRVFAVKAASYLQYPVNA